MASASDHRAHAALQPADCLILLPQRLPAAVETSIGPAHYPAECTQSDAFLQPSLRARKGRANSNSLCAKISLYVSPDKWTANQKARNRPLLKQMLSPEFESAFLKILKLAARKPAQMNQKLRNA